MFPRPSLEYSAWVAQARRLPVSTCDAVFRIGSSVYIGPDNGMTALELETAKVRLPPLDLPRQLLDRVTTAEALDREEALISDYRRIDAVVETHAKATSLRPFPYFRIQPAIIAIDEVLPEFSWNDPMQATQAFLEILTEADGGAPACSPTINIRVAYPDCCHEC